MSAAVEAGGPRRVSLQETGFPRLLFELLRGRFTGTLEVDQAAPEAGRRTIWFRGGMPVFTDWFDQNTLIGQVLIGQNAIDQAALDRALQERQAGEKLGVTLRKLGLIDDGKLREGLREQCRLRLVEAHSLRMGFALVTPTEHDLGADDDLGQVNVLGLVLAGVLAHYDEIRMTLEMRKDAQGPVKATPALGKYAAHFGFSKQDKPIVEALAQGSSLDGLEKLPGVSRKRAAQMIYALWACEMLETESEGARETHITQPMTEYVEAVRRQQGGTVVDRQAKMEAERLVRAGKFGLAIGAIEHALTLNAADADLAAWLPWSRFRSSTQTAPDAEALLVGLEDVTRKHPKHAESHYFRGVAQEALGNETAALEAFTLAYQLDHHLEDALRRARLIRGEAPPPKGGSGQGNMQRILLAGVILIGVLLLANLVIGLDW